jgi:hypothetical protein
MDVEVDMAEARGHRGGCLMVRADSECYGEVERVAGRQRHGEPVSRGRAPFSLERMPHV